MAAPERQPGRTARIEFFRYGPDVQERIDAWARRRGVRILARVPVYFEAHDDA